MISFIIQGNRNGKVTIFVVFKTVLTRDLFLPNRGLVLEPTEKPALGGRLAGQGATWVVQ